MFVFCNTFICIAGVSKNLRKRNETGWQCNRKLVFGHPKQVYIISSFARKKGTIVTELITILSRSELKCPQQKNKRFLGTSTHSLTFDKFNDSVPNLGVSSVVQHGVYTRAKSRDWEKQWLNKYLKIP